MIDDDEPAPQLDLDDWDLEQDWEELVDIPEPPSSGSSLPPWNPNAGFTPSIEPWLAAHPPHAPAGYAPHAPTGYAPPGYLPPGYAPLGMTHSPSHAAPAPEPVLRRPGGFAWFIVSIGLTGLICGVALLFGSTLTGRGELWTLGLPIAVGGQVVLLLGLALQLERIGQGSRKAADKLDHVDEQLHTLQQATTMLGTTHGSASQAFYAHLAEGANPQMLLADVKSQLDLLAMRMSQRNR